MDATLLRQVGRKGWARNAFHAKPKARNEIRAFVFFYPS